MKDITLVAVNWNQQRCVELLLKSYAKYHYTGEPLKLLLVDNGSTDRSIEWLLQNSVPFVSLPKNIGHEPALNIIFPLIQTKYCLLNDTDLEYTDNVYDYIKEFNDTCISAGEYINWDCYHDQKIMPRISPWFWLMDIEAIRQKGITKWREGDNWRYDVGSELWEKIEQAGFANYNIPRKQGNQDQDLISMVYPKFNHWGKTSWDLSKHGDRETEVTGRRNAIKEKCLEYFAIDLHDKFIL